MRETRYLGKYKAVMYVAGEIIPQRYNSGSSYMDPKELLPKSDVGHWFPAKTNPAKFATWIILPNEDHDLDPSWGETCY